MNQTSSYSRGYIIALTATVLWSFTGILISYLSKTYALPSLVLAFWRDLFVSFGMSDSDSGSGFSVPLAAYIDG